MREQTAVEEPPVLSWEQLITDGHVRAARFGRLAPTLLILGVVLTLLGGYRVSTVQRPPPPASPIDLVQQRVEVLQASVLQPMAALSTPIRLEPDELQSTPPADEIPQLVEVVLSGLQVDGKIPDAVFVAEVDPLAFFSATWPVGRLVSVRTDELVALGGIVRLTGRGGFVTPQRWVGLFRRTEQGWRAYTVGGPGLLQPEGLEMVSPTAIPVSLNELMGRGSI